MISDHQQSLRKPGSVARALPESTAAGLRSAPTSIATALTVAFLLLSTGSQVNGRVGPTPLEWIFHNADIVAKGRDVETVQVGEWVLAVFEIEEVIKGDAAPGQRVRYIAEPTWTCDDSRASVGQRALLFLTESTAPDPTFALKRSPIDGRLPPPRKTEEGDPVYSITASGNGRMDIGADGSASIQTYVVVLPPSLEKQAVATDEWGGLSTLPLPVLESHLRSLPTEPSPTPTKKTGPLPPSMLRP